MAGEHASTPAPSVNGQNTVPAVVASVPRIAVTRDEAARSLGMSLDSFERYVQPEVRLIRRGKLRLVPLSELQRWADRAAARALEE